MSLCDERLTKLQERIANPLPTYSREQIQRTRKMQLDSGAGSARESAPPCQSGHSLAKSATHRLSHRGYELQNCYSIAGRQRSNLAAKPQIRISEPTAEGESNSNSESAALVHAEQSNKLTDYFQQLPGRPSRERESFASANFRRLTERAPPSDACAARMLRESEREIQELRGAVEELQMYRERARKLIAEQALAAENLRREEARQWLAARKHTLGELVPFREGARFREVWIDGSDLARVKAELVRLQSEKETAERRRKILKRRSRPGEPQRPVPPAELSDSNSFSIAGERHADEQRELLTAQIVYLAREENALRQRLAELEAAKEESIARAKHTHEEDNSRFGRLTLTDPELKWPFLRQRYQLLSLIGKGGFSEVYRAFDVDELRPVACKIHQLSPSWSEQTKANYIAHILREARVHRAISHPNIVAHYDNVEIDVNSFCTVLEYCNGPDLASYLRRHGTLPEKEAKLIVRQIFSGLRFLGEQNRRVIHYDLKPQNILFHNGVVKISDFGLCKVLAPGDTRLELTSQGVGTYWYLPPECFKEESARISAKVDVWSVGVIYYELLFGAKPFGNDLSQERVWREGVMLRAHSLEFPARPVLSLETREFLRRCLAYGEEERLDVAEACTLLAK